MKRFTVVATVVAMLALVAGSSASANTSSRPCTLGDAQANFQAPLEHLIQSLGICQYRVFFDGSTFTFCEGDFILGGVNNFVDYKASGLTREEGIDELERYGQRVWLDGVEKSLIHTAVKDGIHPRFGHVVYQHYAVITQLAPGHHVSYFEGSTDGVVDFSATVDLDVLPRTDASCS
jgi:hypothetical protein